MQVKAILFDKDGTLFDFHATWSVWVGRAIIEFSQGDTALQRRIAEATHYDFETRKVRLTSPVIACTNRQVSESIAEVIPGKSVEEVEEYLMLSAAEVTQVPVVPLGPCLEQLLARGLALGVMTNDTEYCAHAHLGKAGISDKFRFVAGFDSGFGAKPDPDPLLAFARAIDVAPANVIMVGDSAHDLVAGRAAGMVTMGVLTGVALEHDLAPFADVILPDIGHIHAWLDNPSI